MIINSACVLYDKTYEEYQKGRIPKECWLEFCDALLEYLLVENREVLKRLKNE